MDKLKIENLDLYYEKFHALKSINLSIPRNRIAAFIGPSGCGKSTLLKTLNRMNDLVPGCRVTGKVLLDGDRRAGSGYRCEPAAQARGHGVSKAQPLSHERVRQHRLRPAHAWHPRPRRVWTSWWSSPSGRRPSGTNSRTGCKKAPWPSPAASSSGCASRAPWPFSPRCCLWTRRHLRLDPISTGKIEELAVELKEQYTIVMVTHNMQQALRVSDQTSFFLLGEIVETGPTEKLFSNPREKRTEDYITGRFG